MSVTIALAKKDFSELLGDKFVILAILIYIVLMLGYILNIFLGNHDAPVDKNLLIPVMLKDFSYILSTYMSFISIIIGFAVISHEKSTNALAVLLSKPLYRDTIINGKILSSAMFLLLVILLSGILFFSSLIILLGASLNINLVEISYRLILIILLSFINILFYICVAMLITIVINDQWVALLANVFIYAFIDYLLPTSVASSISYFYSYDLDTYEIFYSLAPQNTIAAIVDHAGLCDLSNNLLLVLQAIWPDIVKIFLFTLVALILVYLSYIRIDVK